jgi:hypothetical protein
MIQLNDFITEEFDRNDMWVPSNIFSQIVADAYKVMKSYADSLNPVGYSPVKREMESRRYVENAMIEYLRAVRTDRATFTGYMKNK